MAAVHTCCEKPRRARPARTRDSRGCSIIAGCHEQEACGPVRPCNDTRGIATRLSRRHPGRRAGGGRRHGPQGTAALEALARGRKSPALCDVRPAGTRRRGGGEVGRPKAGRRQRPAYQEVCALAALRWQGVRTVRDSGSLVAAACLRGIRLERKRPGQDRIYGKAGRCRTARLGPLLIFRIRCYRDFVTITGIVAPLLFF